MEKKRHQWNAGFIWKQRERQKLFSSENEVLYFRKTILNKKQANKLVVRISADSRYRLYINGTPVLAGPCKGTEFNHYYETIDLTDHLQHGENLLAVKVLHYPVMGENLSVHRSPLGMLILEAELRDREDNLVEKIISDESWLCLQDQSMSFISGQYNTMFLGGMELIQAQYYPDGWEQFGYDDSHWEPCRIYDLVDTTTGVLEPWQLYERPIPLLSEIERGFKSVKHISDDSIDINELIQILSEGDDRSLTVPAGKKMIIEVDAGILTTGFPVLKFIGGEGSSVRMLCAECYENEPVEIPWERDKNIRDDADNGQLYGDSDCYSVAGRGVITAVEQYEPFWFRTFRFIRLEIETASSDLTVQSFSYRQTVYPLEVVADFNCSDPSYSKLWDISLNTLRHCMHESYEDCPYYEQYQYTMDTYLQTLFTYNVSGDDRLARKAIHDFHSSLMPQGILQSRFPSLESQIIPGFNIFWIMMIHDHYLNFKDSQLVKRYSSTMDSILSWFDRHLNEKGLVDDIPREYWQFVDWVPEWRAGRGVPTAAETGPLTVYSLMYVTGLQKAAELNRVIGRSGLSNEYLERSETVVQSVLQECRGSSLFQDGPGLELYSQHAQIWAVLAGAVSTEDAAELMKKTLDDKSLAQASYAMSFFLFRALELAGQYENSFKLWSAWQGMADMNLTTWNEDPVTQRSDCHAWGSVPLYEFTAMILGVRPRDMDSEVFIIQPQPGALKWAEGTVVISQGLLNIRWVAEGSDFQIEIKNPSAIELDIHLPDGTVKSSIKDKEIRISNKE